VARAEDPDSTLYDTRVYFRELVKQERMERTWKELFYAAEKRAIGSDKYLRDADGNLVRYWIKGQKQSDRESWFRDGSCRCQGLKFEVSCGECQKEVGAKKSWDRKRCRNKLDTEIVELRDYCLNVASLK